MKYKKTLGVLAALVVTLGAALLMSLSVYAENGVDKGVVASASTGLTVNVAPGGAAPDTDGSTSGTGVPGAPNSGVFTREHVSSKAAILTGVLFASTFATVAIVALTYRIRQHEK